jgi:adenylyl-sulfate kinase
MSCDQRGFTVWFTGLSGSGKTALAVKLADALRSRGMTRVERLDGDIVRKSLTRDLGFSKEDRDKNIERVTFVAKLLTRNGVATICSFISPYRAVRARSREEIGTFIEVFCSCPIEVLIERDVKGLYKKALAGEIENFTGVSDPYEDPLAPEVVVETDKETIEASLDKILAYLEAHDYIPVAQVEEDAAEDEVYSADEEAEIEERLRSLGYL